MLQFYFLSIILNVVAGFVLVFSNEVDSSGLKDSFSLRNETFKLVAGILAIVIGLLKLLSPVEDTIPVLGDLLPALAGLVSGFAMVFEFYRGRTTLDIPESAGKVDSFILINKRIIGIAAFAAAVLHFLFPKVILL